MMEKRRLLKIRKAVFSWPYNLIFILTLISYLFLTVYVNELHVTAETLFNTAKSFLIPFLTAHIIIALLVPITIILIVLRVRELQEINSIAKGGSVSLIGTFIGILGGACPGCFAGLLPAIVGIFGSSFALTDLPFFGLEIQMLSIILLIISISILTKDISC